MNELKPCPFCGTIPQVTKETAAEDSTPIYSVVCEANGCFVRPEACGSLDIDKAVKTWNNRTEPKES